MPLERPEQLDAIAQTVREKGKHLTSLRKVLDMYGYSRRGSTINKVLREHLNELDIATAPDFEAVYIDAPLYLVEREPTNQVTTDSQAAGAGVPEVDVSESEQEAVSPAHRISRLKAASAGVKSVSPDATLEYAITLMLEHDYSQLPVMQNERTPKGVVSWKSIGRFQSLGKACSVVRDCVEPHHEVTLTASIIDVIPMVTKYGCVLVRDDQNKINGIVTASDLAEQFQTLSEPFLVLGDIETRLRHLIDDRFDAAELAHARDPNDSSRTVESASDMTFGEYKRLLEEPTRWEKAALRVDRKSFVASLDEVREIRNDVMHFDPDGLDEAKLKRLRDFNRLLACILEARGVA